MKEWEIKKMLLSDLKEAEYNPRVIDENAFYKLGNSIDEFGLVVPIVWNKRSGNIVGGHQRIKFLKLKETEEVDVVIVDLDENDEVALNITLNNPHIQGDFIEESVDMLNGLEKDFGRVFAEVGLNDLSEMLNGIKWDDSGLPDKPEKDEESEDEDEGDMPGEFHNIPDEYIGIDCPRCHSVWHRESGRVLKNNND